MDNFDFNQKISSSLAFSLILVLGLVVVWFALSAGNNIIANAPKSKIFNPVANDLK